LRGNDEIRYLAKAQLIADGREYRRHLHAA